MGYFRSRPCRWGQYFKGALNSYLFLRILNHKNEKVFSLAVINL